MDEPRASDLTMGIGNPKFLLSPGLHGDNTTDLPLRGDVG